jgi:hypothetical protein
MNPLFDVEKIEERLKNVKSLADLTGKDGVLKKEDVKISVVFPKRVAPIFRPRVSGQTHPAPSPAAA